MTDYTEKIEEILPPHYLIVEPGVQTFQAMAFYEKLEQLLQDAQRNIEKAYGGCRKCYGKGYSTVRHGLTGFDDFGGDGFESPIRTHMKFCTCDRGKQLESLQHPKDDKQASLEAE